VDIFYANNHVLCPCLEETRLAMISVPGTDSFREKIKYNVPHLLNRNFGEIHEKAFSLGQLQQKTSLTIRSPHRQVYIKNAQDR
jgi:hypothetical protein